MPGHTQVEASAAGHLCGPELSCVAPQDANLLTVTREISADLDTPVSAYLKLAGLGSSAEPKSPLEGKASAHELPAGDSESSSFLLESVTGGEQVARYSFIGAGLRRAYVMQGGRFRRIGPEGTELLPMAPGSDPLSVLRSEFMRYKTAAPAGGSARPGEGNRPRFVGGLVGYLAYDAVRYLEPAVGSPPGPARDTGPDLPEAVFLLADTVVAFDHAYGRMILIANVPVDTSEAAARAQAETRLDQLAARLDGASPLGAAPRPGRPGEAPRPGTPPPASNMGKEEFMAAVERAQEHIAAGDIFQVVLSQRFTRRTTASPLAIYRALRRLNPSPYMFFFNFAGLAEEPWYLIGASPETHVRLSGRQAILRPIAGTRPRGADAVADAEHEAGLMADPKERAEHVMLVDLARNDLGRVCQYGSVHVPELMGVERYSHVMHIVSQVEGCLGAGRDAFDLLRATFPAGTVSGAPKIRAMQIIDQLEGSVRGPYAGAVGYFSFDGSLDTCITIRTLLMRGDVVSIQAGAGIVADSDPEREHEETVNKARALVAAVEAAETPTAPLHGMTAGQPDEKEGRQ